MQPTQNMNISTGQTPARQTIIVQTNAPVPVSRQIAEQIRQAIRDGSLALGTALPSVREYAQSLGVSRSTVSRAVEELASQGYVIAEQGSGTRVADHLPGELPELFRPRSAPAAKREVELTAFAQRLMNSGFSTEDLSTLVQGRPVVPDGLLRVWKELLHRYAKLTDVSLQEYVLEPFGYEPLREAYASYLIRARAVRAAKEQIAVFNAKELRIDMICRLLLKPADVVAVEDPGYVTGRRQYQVNGARVLPIAVDKDGLVVDELIKAGATERIKLVHVTPSHHSPTGAVLSLERREKLLKWAKDNQVYIVEDDYDSEFRYDGRPLPSLQGMSDGENVIYISCLWRLIAPVCRLGFLTVPPSLVSAFRSVKALFERDVCLIDQLVLTDFINEGHLERSVRRLRSVYSSKREAVVSALHQAFGANVEFASEAAGLEVMIRFKGAAYTDQAVDEAARACGLTMYSTAPYYVQAHRGCEFVLAFAQFGEAELARRIQAFASQLAAAAVPGPASVSEYVLQPVFAPVAATPVPAPALPTLGQPEVVYSSPNPAPAPASAPIFPATPAPISPPGPAPSYSGVS